jgi:hypothetical protein
MNKRRVADPLREYADNLANGRVDDYEPSIIAQFIHAHADQIDCEHERRMDQAREDSRKATCNYVSRIIADYKRGKKWKRKEYSNG